MPATRPAAKPSAARTASRRAAKPAPRWLDWRRPLAERVADLVGRLSLAEKVRQLVHDAPAVERLEVPAYNWWNECLHGVGRAGRATVFPQAIGLAASWDAGLLQRVADAISDEARAKHAIFAARGRRGIYRGLTFWTPNINIYRDPRWGRGQETYGEDPLLTGTLAAAFIRGLQGDDPRHLKLVATAKHYAVHSGPESQRHTFDAACDERDLRLTYLPAFEMAVKEGGAVSIMGAYNRTNGDPCCGHRRLLQDILRGEWGFDGYVVSDCGAIHDFHLHHRITKDAAESAALAVKNGCDLECGLGPGGPVYHALEEAVSRGLITETEIDVALTRAMTARFRLGLFDPPERVRWNRVKPGVVSSAKHRALARDAARRSLVLLENRNGLLPLPKDLGSVVVVGPNADTVDVLLGNYSGLSPQMVTVLEGITGAVSPATSVQFFRGCDLVGTGKAGFPAAVWTAEQADVVIAVMGLSPRYEGEEGEACLSDKAGDRGEIGLPGVQLDLLKAIKEKGRKLVVVLTGGGAIAEPWLKENADAVLLCWYPGEEGGNAVADAIFGDHNPAGRLPVTFYRALADLPPFASYAMEGRTYRYFRGEPLWPFGHGLSYTSFAYRDVRVAKPRAAADGTVTVIAKIANIGGRDGDEVVQVYARDVEASTPVPRHQLVAFARVAVKTGRTATVRLSFPVDRLALVRDDGARVVEPGEFRIWVGGGQPDAGAPGAWIAVRVG